MSTESATAGQAPRRRSGWRDWLLVLLAALALLMLSQALWLWETWPVRELLHGAPAAARAAPSR